MNRAFVAWPGWPFLRYAWLLSLANALWFALIYTGSDWVTARRGWHVPIHFSAELSIPLIPSAVVVYMSIYLLFLAGPFIIRQRAEFAALIRALFVATCLGAIGFLLLPARSAFPQPEGLGIWKRLFEFADWMNLDYNMAPSLHVALSMCCIAAFARYASASGRIVLWTWGAAIAISTLLTHQHHVLDVGTGLIVAWLACRISGMTTKSCARPISCHADDQTRVDPIAEL
jgi:membrane-associated phospholipid phosphatase